jgi:hypothetical protein
MGQIRFFGSRGLNSHDKFIDSPVNTRLQGRRPSNAGRTYAPNVRASFPSVKLASRCSFTGEHAARHPVVYYERRGAAPTAIEQRLDALEEGLVKDLGESPSTAEIALIQSARMCLGVCLMSDA